MKTLTLAAVLVASLLAAGSASANTSSGQVIQPGVPNYGGFASDGHGR